MVPPFVGVAVKVTLVPEQIVVPGLAEIDTEGVTAAFTTIVIVLEVAVGVERQPALDVITQLTWSLFANALLEYVEAFVPTFVPFNFH